MASSLPYDKINSTAQAPDRVNPQAASSGSSSAQQGGPVQYTADQIARAQQAAQQDYISQHPYASPSSMYGAASQNVLNQYEGSGQYQTDVNNLLTKMFPQNQSTAQEGRANNNKATSETQNPAAPTQNSPTKQIQTAADQFMANMPSIINNQMQAAATNARNQVAQGINANNAAYNQRGLLYSGLAGGGANDVQANVGNQLAQQQAAINQNALNTSSALNSGALNAQQAQAQLQQGYNQANNQYVQGLLNLLQNRVQGNNQAITNLLGAGSGLLGMGAGSLFSPSASGGGYNPEYQQLNFNGEGLLPSQQIASYQLPFGR